MFVHECPIDKESSLAWVIALYQTENKVLVQSKIAYSISIHICINRPNWVQIHAILLGKNDT